MATYFNINYEFDRDVIHRTIESRISGRQPGYICVADGVIMDIANRNPEYLDVINSSIFSICDSSYVPLYIRLIHGNKYAQYSGSEIFRDIISSKKYRMIFMGSHQNVLDALQKNISNWNPMAADMTFVELPFCTVDNFNYAEIAEMIKNDGADIIWISLGAPKQEYFMHRLLPHLDRGIMIAVGAAFKFYSGLDVKRAPRWMVNNHLEFLHRIYKEPRKQFGRCTSIIRSLPRVLYREVKNRQ